MKIKFSRLAIEDLDLIYNFYSENSDINGIEQIKLIKNTIDYLSIFPKMGKELSEIINDRSFNECEYRVIIVKKRFFVVYYLFNNEIIVSRIFSSKQNYTQILIEMF